MLLQSQNAANRIKVTDSPIVRDPVNPEQLLKALYPIYITASPIVSEPVNS